VDRYLALETPIASGHLGLVAELAAQGRDVVADYGVNCFNPHTARELFGLGAARVVLSVELTADEMGEVAEPWGGRGFDVFMYGRPEGMTLEHCVLSAAFDREVATCRDLCVQKHPDVRLTDPTGKLLAELPGRFSRRKLRPDIERFATYCSAREKYSGEEQVPAMREHLHSETPRVRCKSSNVTFTGISPKLSPRSSMHEASITSGGTISKMLRVLMFRMAIPGECDGGAVVRATL
jgi:collagenase-like PrtC family protease